MANLILICCFAFFAVASLAAEERYFCFMTMRKDSKSNTLSPLAMISFTANAVSGSADIAYGSNRYRMSHASKNQLLLLDVTALRPRQLASVDLRHVYKLPTQKKFNDPAVSIETDRSGKFGLKCQTWAEFRSDSHP